MSIFRHLFKRAIVAILTAEARLLLARTKPTIIGITGNVGKTSTKDAIFAVLQEHVHARKSEKSYNSDISIPLTILGLQNAWYNPIRWLKNVIDGAIIAFFPGEYPKVLVLEMGVDRPGDMKKLTAWVKPDIVVLTRLPDVPVHVEYFATPDEVIAEKRVLVDALKPDGVFVYNHDDERVRQVAEEVRQQAIGYSRYSLSQFTASADKIIYDGGVAVGLEFVLTHLDKSASMRINGSLGVQHAYNYAAGAAVGSIFDIPLEEAMRALREHTPPPGRMRLIRGAKNVLIIDDTYNSSPTATERALQTIKEMKGAKRKVAILGDMLELGQYSVREHEKIGEDVPGSVAVLITVGIRSRKIAEAALEQGMSEKNIYQYDDVIQLRKEIHNLIQSGDVVLIKASQSIRAELIVVELMAEPERAEELLVRQDPVWLQKPVHTLV